MNINRRLIPPFNKIYSKVISALVVHAIFNSGGISKCTAHRVPIRFYMLL